MWTQVLAEFGDALRGAADAADAANVGRVHGGRLPAALVFADRASLAVFRDATFAPLLAGRAGLSLVRDDAGAVCAANDDGAAA